MNRDPEDLISIANEYLELGGLFNPELMEHKKVSELIIGMRDALLALSKGRKITIELEYDDHDLACFHDVILDALGPSLNDEGILVVFESLPKDIRITAFQWGMSDTCFRDAAYVYLQEHKDQYVFEK